MQMKYFLLLFLLLLSYIAAAPVSLTNGTATHSQPSWSVDGAVDGNTGTGWAISFRTAVNEAIAETAVWETTTNISATSLTFTMEQYHGSQHILGCFRFSITSDDRSLFADGLDANGDVTANWVILTPSSVSVPSGLTSSIQTNGSILVTGSNATATYTVQYTGNFHNITGIRLEALEDSRLSTGGATPGPGLQPINGNFVLYNLGMDASGTPNPVPEPASSFIIVSSIFLGFLYRTLKNINS